MLKRLEEAKEASSTTPCALIKVLTNGKISVEERAQFFLFMAVPQGVPGRVTNVALANVLRAEGYDISDTAVDRHRRGSCSCRRMNGDKK